jgi:hypothetical protein
MSDKRSNRYVRKAREENSLDLAVFALFAVRWLELCDSLRDFEKAILIVM